MTVAEPESQETTALAIPETTSLAVALAKAEVDQQVMTARAMRRNLTEVAQEIMRYVQIDDETAEECIFALPRGDAPIKGPSIRFAEIVANAFGNCRSAARIVHVDRVEKFVEAEGVFHDLQKNTASTAHVRRRIFDKRGRLFTEDMILVTGNAAGAIAKRNAILAGVPKPIWRPAYERVESVLAGDTKTLGERLAVAIRRFAAFGIKPDQLFAVLGISGPEEIAPDHIVTLQGMRSAILSGEATVEEMFRPRPAEAQQDLQARLDALATPPPPHDPETGEILIDKSGGGGPSEPGDKLLDAAQARARQGPKSLTRWVSALSEANYAEVERHLPELRALAEQNRKSEDAR